MFRYCKLAIDQRRHYWVHYGQLPTSYPGSSNLSKRKDPGYEVNNNKHSTNVFVFRFSTYLGVRGVLLSKLPFFLIDLLPGVSPLPAGPSMLPPGANINKKYYTLNSNCPIKKLVPSHNVSWYRMPCARISRRGCDHIINLVPRVIFVGAVRK